MATATQNITPKTGARVRDPRLDFYRGIAMLIIFTSHTPGNFWGDWIPGRFGFSDATEIFVFCSGMASAIAFGGSYDRRGWFLGTARVFYRCWQVYWAHICLFFALAFMLVTLDGFGFEKNYVNSLNLGQFFNDTKDHLFGLLTLTYVPNYFDILPMYIAILLLMPIVMALSTVHVSLVFAFCLSLWFIAQTRVMMNLGIEQFAVSLPASLTSDRAWFFNPFAWQIVFFTGFALVRGWIPRPPVNAVLITIAAIIVLGMMTLSHVAIREWGFSWAADWRRANPELVTKTDFGIARYTHFLALAYLAYAVAGDGGRRLIITGQSMIAVATKNLIALLTKVGQQSLAVFIVSMMLSIFVGFALTETGARADDVTSIKSHTYVAVGNILGWVFLVFIAYTAAWFKDQPWRKSATG
jgi:hypothetical protein